LVTTRRRVVDAQAAELRRIERDLHDGALAELRRLVRGIHPPILTDRGLVAALAALAGDAPLPVQVLAGDLGTVPLAVESAAYFVTAEALANVVKHAEASTCTVTLSRTSDVLTVEVRDDGRGGADPSGSGVDGLRRRVEALDGVMSVTSPAGGPTIVHAELPCAS
jgi:signal transduction histidine kinase